MDISAAVVRETYGLAACYRLDQLRLAKTRVVTNIHDPSLTARLPYVPEKAGFAADPHLLGLLVEPLYGDSPQTGIRELLQNGVDAVRERLHFCEMHGIDKASSTLSGSAC